MKFLLATAMIIGLLVGGIGLGLLPVNLNKRVNFQDVEEVRQQYETLKANIEQSGANGVVNEELKQMEEELNRIPSKGRVTASKLFAVTTSLLTFGFVIIVFLKKNLVNQVSLIIAVLAIISYLLTPSIPKTGRYGAADPSTIAIIGCIGVIATAVFGRLFYKKVSNSAA